MIEKRKYLLLSSLAGFSWMIVFPLFINFIGLNETIDTKIKNFIFEFPDLAFWFFLTLWVLPVPVLSYILSENKIVDFGTKK